MATDARAQAIVGPMRPPFLLLNPVCVLLGLAVAVFEGYSISILYLVLALIGATAAHVAVNALNEYHDFRSGLDFKTQRTPFSGGSGSLPAQPHRGHYGLIVGLAALAVVVAVGAYFWAVHGPAILPLGLLGILTIAAYTPLLTRSVVLCLIAPGLGFGTLMVLGTFFALTGTYSWAAFTASLVPFFLVSNLLLMNQFPDVEPDRSVGRRHILIVWGRRAGVAVFAAFNIAAYVSIVAGFLLGLFPVWSLIALATLALAVPVTLALSRYHSAVPQLVPSMGKNVVLILVTPVLLAVGLFLGK